MHTTTPQRWKTHYGELPPIGHRLRASIPTRWLRIHSLPESRRYAETDAEYATLLERHNAVAGEILGQDADAVLFLHCYAAPNEVRATFEPFAWATDARIDAAAFTMVPATDEDELDITVAACQVRWAATAWDALIKDVADDEMPSVLFFNPKTGEAYAPYDGGADIFVADPQRVADLKTQWSAWLSAHPKGL